MITDSSDIFHRKHNNDATENIYCEIEKNVFNLANRNLRWVER